jgi:hypothetical protein
LEKKLNMSLHSAHVKKLQEENKIKRLLTTAIIITVYFSAFGWLHALNNGWHVTILNNPNPGYIKFDWIGENGFSLYDNYGIPQYVDSIITEQYKISNFKLLNNGNWIALGLPTLNREKYYLMDQDLNIMDSLPLVDNLKVDMHDVCMLSNGHYLILYLKTVEVDMSKLIEGGNPNAHIKTGVIIETDRDGTIYWQWESLDHLDITDATSDVNLTGETIDFPHINAFCEDSDGNIVVSFRFLDEVSKIDKETGNFIWRFGGTNCKNNEFDILNDDHNGFDGFTHQHSVKLLPNGNILLYDNGNLRTPKFSRAVEYQLDIEEKTARNVWEYRYSPDIFYGAMGSVDRFDDGSTLINWGANKITEVNSINEISYELNYSSDGGPYQNVYRAYRYITKMNAVTKSVNGAGTYNFNSQEYQTGASLVVTSADNAGRVTVEKHEYAPPIATYNDSVFNKILPYRWVISSQNINNLNGTIKIKLSSLGNFNKPGSLKIHRRSQEASGIFYSQATDYNSQSQEIYAPITGIGEFAVSYFEFGKPKINYPKNDDTSVAISGKIKWDTLPGAKYYQLQVARESDFSNPLLDKVTERLTEAEYLGIDYYTEYYCRVRGINTTDTSVWSEIITFKTEIIPAVTLMYPVNMATGYILTDSLSWKTIPAIDSYEIQISRNSDYSDMIICLDTLKNNFWRNTNLGFNTKYYWRVKAIQNSTEGDWSAARTFTTIISPPFLLEPHNDTTDIPTDVILTWESVEGAESYQIQVSGNPDFKKTILNIKDYKKTDYIYNDFIPSSEYFWRVRAFSGIDTSSWSDVFSFSTGIEPPALIYPDNGRIKVPLSAKFLWDSIPTARDYEIIIARDPQFVEYIVDSTKLKNAYFIIDNLPESTTLYWRVKACYKDGCSIWSEPWCFKTDVKEISDAPVLLYPPGNSVKFIDGKLIWSKDKQAVYYKLQLSVSKDFKLSALDTIISGDTLCLYSGLKFDTKYYWRVMSVYLDDSSKWSDYGIFITQPEKIRLTTPLNEQINVSTEVLFTWGIPGVADSYHFQLSTRKDFSSIIIDSAGFITNEILYSGLINNKQYYWRVRYSVSGKWYTWSSISSFCTKALNSLQPPLLSAPENGIYCSSVDVLFKWNPVKNAESYKIAVSTFPDYQETVISESDINAVEYKSPSLNYNQKYYWKVFAVGADAQSEWSEEWNFTTELMQPYPIYPVENMNEVPLSGTIKWKNVEFASAYHLQISGAEDFAINIIDEPAITDTAFDYSLAADTRYFWRIKAISGMNSSRWSDKISFITEPATEVNDQLCDKKFAIYPNPASDKIFYNIKENNFIKFAIYSPEGIIISEGFNSNGIIDISHILPGCYYIRMNNRILKFIKFEY